MEEYYSKEELLKKHKSPTKRLIEQKNSTWEHKELFQNKISNDIYQLTYTTRPGKSYVI